MRRFYYWGSPQQVRGAWRGEGGGVRADVRQQRGHGDGGGVPGGGGGRDRDGGAAAAAHQLQAQEAGVGPAHQSEVNLGIVVIVSFKT